MPGVSTAKYALFVLPNYTLRKQSGFGGSGVYRNHPVRPSVQKFYNRNFSLTNEVILMKLYTVAVYHLKMCSKEYKPSVNKCKGR